MRIYLIRHAEEGEDGGISDLGQRQAQALGLWLKNKKIAAVYSSDRPRASETAAVVGYILRLKPQVIPNFEEVRELEPLESIAEARERAERGIFWAISQNRGRDIAIVSHSKLIRQLLAKLGLHKYEEDADLPNTGIVALEYQDGNFKLLDYGITP